MINNAIMNYPDNYLFYRTKANLLINSKKYNEAIEYLNKSLALNYDYVTYFDRGWTLIKLSQPELAVSDLTKCIDLYPHELQAYLYLGIAYSKLSMYTQSIECLNTCLEMDPFNTQALSYIGRAMYNLERYRESLMYFDKCLKVNPIDANSQYVKGNVYLKLEHYDYAIVCYDKCLKINSNHTPAINNKLYAKNMINQLVN
eukprot:Mrub_07491.p1 GENE.Mrub_07491~~Mrub_07491.p1  ORF type:complete len:227 (-),score=18.43 Mrub_07491:235-837(-)